ncbi:MAG TPA: winged helix-turn-helix transcriptional regulator [Ferrovibrio sp.]|uniref:winged helix-turn-helix transcriptional regulator n=1 Tax=Ferrovibrio sp. TaxID=1917215 RepID=UPI002ED5AFEA
MNKPAGKPPEPAADAATMAALLDAISSGDEHTQRSLAGRLDIALGLANALLKRCVSKGLIKIQSAPARRYAYYLTPKGFAEKSRLVAEYLTVSLDFFRHARGQYEEAFARQAAAGVTSVAIAGSGELAEIALLSASACGLRVAAVIAPGKNVGQFHGRPVVADLAAALALGAEVVAVADNATPQATYDRLIGGLPADRLLAPPLLHVMTAKPGTRDEAA